MKIKNLFQLQLAISFIALFICANANATLIEYSTQGEFLLGGESIAPSTYSSSMDQNKINFEFDSEYLISNFSIPFNTREATYLIDITIKDNFGNVLTNYNCNPSNGVVTCGSIDPISHIFGEINFVDNSNYLFNGMDLNATSDKKVTMTDFANLELFPTINGPGITYNVSSRTAVINPVNAPASIGLFALVSFILLRRNK
ncbi:hypothetical protein [Alteromonas antoniana]|uniref:hypothetical protein n=1 Tax=Alteromonas antoniana TaxID=2803813 RepID=UPI001C437260|nr:hypothetical protein [Alteromonas antoniana]